MGSARGMVTAGGAAALAASMWVAGCGSSSGLARPDLRKIGQSFGGAELIVVTMHADEETSYRMGAAVMEARGALTGLPVAYVKADYGEDLERSAGATLADYGLFHVYAENDRDTGVLYLVDASDGAILDRVSGHGLTAGALERRIERALVRASAEPAPE